MSVSAAVNESEGQRQAMFWRWKKAVFLMWLKCRKKERVGSRMIPRLRISVEGVTRVPSIIECETVVGACEGVRTNDYDFRYIAVEFQEVFMHPCFNVR